MGKAFRFFIRQYKTIKQGGQSKFLSVLKRSVQFLIGIIPAFFFLIIVRLIRSFFLVRINRLIGLRIGHLAANTEIYLCELDAGINVPKQKYVDISFFGGARIANQQLGNMWKRSIKIWPKWFMEPLFYLNQALPGGQIHETENEVSDFQYGRDVKGLMANSKPHISFSAEEELRGKAGLKELGITEDSKFICLIVRDSAYLNAVLPNPDKWNYHDYRDSDIQTYVETAEALADLGYYVLRMGEVVNQSLVAKNPKVVDYATNGMRSDFMDIYLGANCFFCITVGTGYDAVPMIFRKPMVFVNAVPIGFLSSFIKNCVCINKKHRLISNKKLLSLREIFDFNVGYCTYSNEYQSQGVELLDNNSKEIRAAVFELLKRLTGEWQPQLEDVELQKQFWNIFPKDANNSIGRPLHDKILASYGTEFLRENKEWLQ